MYAAIVWWKHLSSVCSSASLPGWSAALCAAAAAVGSPFSAAAAVSVPVARMPSIPSRGSSRALAMASSSGGAVSFSDPGFWKYLYGFRSVCTATSALAVLTGDCSLPTMRLDSCIAWHSAGSKSGQHLARVTSSVTMILKDSARSLTMGPAMGATTRARRMATRVASLSCCDGSLCGHLLRTKLWSAAAAGTATAAAFGSGPFAAPTHWRSAPANPALSDAALSSRSAAAILCASAAVVSWRSWASRATSIAPVPPLGTSDTAWRCAWNESNEWVEKEGSERGLKGGAGCGDGTPDELFF